MSYIGVYKAVYAYSASTAEELTIAENDILYVIEKSDVDDWWTVKKRLVGSDIEEPTGLVPSTYIEPAEVIGSAVALYDYTKQTDEELSFKEGDTFKVYDTSDIDWILVSDSGSQKFGFVPANYVDISLGNSGTMASSSAPAASAVAAAAAPVVSNVNARPDPATFAKPPQRLDRQQVQKPLPKEEHRVDSYADSVKSFDSEPELPPAKPKRPSGSNGHMSRERKRVTNDDIPRIDDDDFDVTRDRSRSELAGLYTWNVAEVEGKKKKKLTLGIGKGKIYLNPDPSTGDEPRSWPADKLISFSAEKKHVFLDFKGPPASIELHVGSKDTARDILSLLGEISGAISASALEEIKAASKPTANGYKTGQVLYDFTAQNKDELNAQEGDLVYVVNDKKSPDWWLVENIDTGKRGVVPSTYISIGGETGGFSLGDIGKRTKDSFKSKKTKDREAGERKDREREIREREREREREKEKRARERERERRKKDSSSGKSKAKPNPNKIRTWVDKSGSFKVEAEFLGCVEGKIHLHKSNGVKIAVAADKLSLTDIEYVERVTGFSLDKYKPKKKEKHVRSKEKRTVPSTSAKKDEYDWFEFFLNCGVDLSQCQRYTLNFEREQLGESSLEDINAPLLRNLGLREGDIIRVMKFLDKKFNRVHDKEPVQTPTEPAVSRPKAPKIDSTNLNGGDDEDEAWTIKPSASQTETKQIPVAPPVAPPAETKPRPQITGSLQDLVDLKPLDANYTSSSLTKSNPLANASAVPALQPSKTGSSIQLGQQKTGSSINNLLAQKTGSSIKSQKTGGSTLQPLDPFKTGGHNILPVATGAPLILPYATGGASVIVPVQTMQPVLIGQPTTTFNTGTSSIIPLQPVRTGGQVPLQITGGALPQTSFNTGYPTGMQSFPTGGYNNQPVTSFGAQQLTGGFMPQQIAPQTSFGAQQPGVFSNQFNTGFNQTAPQTSFGSTTPGINGLTNMFQNTGISQPQQQMQGMSSLQMLHNMQQQQQQQQQPFQQPLQQPVTGAPMVQQQQQFTGAPMIQQQPFQTGNLFSPNMQNQSLPQTTFSPTLTSQPTGFGFGNSPAPTSFGNNPAPTSFGNGTGSTMSQPTGRLANATPDNPFGF